MNWLFILLGIGVIIIFAVVRMMNQHAAEERLRASQEIVNEAMRIVLPSLSKKLKLAEQGSVRSALVADIWGRDILAFEFTIPVQESVDTSIVYYELMDILKAYANGHDIERLQKDLPAFVVSDVWYDQKSATLHVDVAHVLNDATYAYLADLKKINQSQFDNEKRV